MLKYFKIQHENNKINSTNFKEIVINDAKDNAGSNLHDTLQYIQRLESKLLKHVNNVNVPSEMNPKTIYKQIKPDDLNENEIKDEEKVLSKLCNNLIYESSNLHDKLNHVDLAESLVVDNTIVVVDAEICLTEVKISDINILAGSNNCIDYINIEKVGSSTSVNMFVQFQEETIESENCVNYLQYPEVKSDEIEDISSNDEWCGDSIYDNLSSECEEFASFFPDSKAKSTEEHETLIKTQPANKTKEQTKPNIEISFIDEYDNDSFEDFQIKKPFDFECHHSESPKSPNPTKWVKENGFETDSTYDVHVIGDDVDDNAEFTKEGDVKQSFSEIEVVSLNKDVDDIQLDLVDFNLKVDGNISIEFIDNYAERNKKSVPVNKNIEFIQEGELQIEPHLWKIIFDEKNGKFFPRIWTSTFAEKLATLTGCIIYFKGNDVLPRNSPKTKSISIRGYCKHENCRQYKLIWVPDPDSESKNFIIMTTLNPKQHFLDLTRWCNGLARTNLKEKSKLLYPEDMFKNELDNMDMELRTKEKNLQGLISKDSLRKVRSEQLCEKQMDKDDLIDLKIQKQLFISRNESYIQEIIDPFIVYLYSDAQFDVLKKLVKERTDSEIVVHIDSTGAVVRSPSSDCKMIYYYAVIITFKTSPGNNSKELYPIWEMISSEHGTAAIGNWLRTTKYKFNSDLWFNRFVFKLSIYNLDFDFFFFF